MKNIKLAGKLVLILFALYTIFLIYILTLQSGLAGGKLEFDLPIIRLILPSPILLLIGIILLCIGNKKKKDITK